MPRDRIDALFRSTRGEGRAALVAYLMIGDPDLETSFHAACALIENGADILELGAPFTDPMADGPSIQLAGQRSLAAGTTIDDVLSIAKRIRDLHPNTPLILMGYANPVLKMGFEAFADAAQASGLDGTILVDLPPEEDAPLRAAYARHELAVIRLATPTTTEARMSEIARGASGFLYFVSVTGVTGARRAEPTAIADKIDLARRVSNLPVCVGFGVRTPDEAAAMAEIADGVVVGSAFVDHVARANDAGDPAAAPRGMGGLAAKLSAAIKSVGAGSKPS
ncbi:MAG: tryptophan synthase subunit alpha [Pseudomonadota bacterium]